VRYSLPAVSLSSWADQQPLMSSTGCPFPRHLAVRSPAHRHLHHQSQVPDALIPHKTFTGNRPSSSIMLPDLSAYTTGQILALYEHVTAAMVRKRCLQSIPERQGFDALTKRVPTRQPDMLIWQRCILMKLSVLHRALCGASTALTSGAWSWARCSPPR
jgi:hypothetical protein